MPIAYEELNRQFRVTKQTLSMYTILRDRYARLALIVDIILLACAVVFCSTTFARDEVFGKMGLSAPNIRFVLGIASILAFFTSLVSLRVGWKGKAALHREAAQKLTSVLTLFRESRMDDGTWLQDRSVDLHRAYWEAMNNVIEIPARQFAGLKSKHLRKVQISKMLDATPGCPVFVLRLILFYQSTKRALSTTKTTRK